MKTMNTWRFLAVLTLIAGTFFASCQDSSISGIDDDINEYKTEDKSKAVANGAITSNTSVLFEDDFESNSISDYTLGAFGPSNGSAVITGGEVLVNGNFVKSFAPNSNFSGNQIDSDNGFSICMDVSPLSARPGGNNNAVRLSVSMGHESLSDAVAGFDGNSNNGYIRIGGNLGVLQGPLNGTYDENPALGKTYRFTMTVETDGIENGNSYTATVYMDAVEIASFTGQWDSDNNYIGIHAIDGNWSIDNLVINSSTQSPCLPTVKSNLFISNGDVRTWDPLYPDANDNRYFDWPANICVDTPDFGLNANWVNEKNASVISQVATFETFQGYEFEAEWINAWPSLSSSQSGGPSFGGWNNVSWTKYSTTVNGDAGDYVIQFLADNCSWIYLDGELIGYQDASFTNSNNNGKYPLALNGSDQELSFIIFDGGGEAGGKFRLETLTSFLDNGGDEDDFGTPPVTNTAPVANAGTDQTLDATGQTTAVTLDGSGSSDVDGDALSYSWILNGNEVSTNASFTTDLADGSYTFTLTVSDNEASSSDDVTVTVVNTVPVADAGTDQTLEATGPTTTVTLSGSGTDADGDALSYSWSNGSTSASQTVALGVGTHTFTLTVADGQGASDTDEVTITITDTTSPELTFTTETNSLWPPNHKMVLVVSGISASDLVDGSTSVDITVSSNEDANGRGDGNTDEDYEIKANLDGTFDVYVRAERAGGGGGRNYTISLSTTDVAGNTSGDSVEVSVAGNQGKGKGGKKK